MIEILYTEFAQYFGIPDILLPTQEAKMTCLDKSLPVLDEDHKGAALSDPEGPRIVRSRTVPD